MKRAHSAMMGSLASIALSLGMLQAGPESQDLGGLATYLPWELQPEAGQTHAAF
jgi:hypothetical protein